MWIWLKANRNFLNRLSSRMPCARIWRSLTRAHPQIISHSMQFSCSLFCSSFVIFLDFSSSLAIELLSKPISANLRFSFSLVERDTDKFQSERGRKMAVKWCLARNRWKWKAFDAPGRRGRNLQCAVFSLYCKWHRPKSRASVLVKWHPFDGCVGIFSNYLV